MPIAVRPVPRSIYGFVKTGSCRDARIAQQPEPAPPVEEGTDAIGLSVRLYDTALEIFEATRPPDHPNVALAHMELAGALARGGRAVEAVAHARRAHAIYQKALGDEHAVTAISLSNTGKALLAAGRAVEAHPLLERAVDVLSRVRPEGQGMPEALATLGRCLMALDRRAEATALLERALRLARAQTLSPRFIADTQGLLDDRKP